MNNETPLSPSSFFQISLDCRRLPAKSGNDFKLNAKNFTSYLLPDLSNLVSCYSFAQIAMGWSVEGLEIYISSEEPFESVSYPNYERADSFELCLDTRDIKTSGYNTRFCHHFFFLPEKVEGIDAGEDTKFRTEDAHDLCHGADLRVKSTLKKDSYILQCFIPAHCLHGYDPEQFNRLGVTYRLNGKTVRSQQFSVDAEEFKFQEQPSLWASMRLVS